jgi:alkylation response protein AidB-like acyl-CoA dehydrogenase
MRISAWSRRIVWFALGAAATAWLTLIPTLHDRRVEASSPVAAGQDLQQRVASLEQRLAAVEAWIKQANEAAKPDRRPDRDR